MVLTRRKAAAASELPPSRFFDPIAAALVSRRNIGDGQFGAGGRRIANWYVNLPALLVGLVLVVRGAISPALLHIGLTTFLVTEVHRRVRHHTALTAPAHRVALHYRSSGAPIFAC